MKLQVDESPHLLWHGFTPVHTCYAHNEQRCSWFVQIGSNFAVVPLLMVVHGWGAVTVHAGHVEVTPDERSDYLSSVSQCWAVRTSAKPCVDLSNEFQQHHQSSGYCTCHSISVVQSLKYKGSRASIHHHCSPFCLWGFVVARFLIKSRLTREHSQTCLQCVRAVWPLARHYKQTPWGRVEWLWLFSEYDQESFPIRLHHTGVFLAFFKIVTAVLLSFLYSTVSPLLILRTQE